jgi:hypothetical protein
LYTVEKHKGTDGDTMAVISLESNTLPYVSVDTYQSFNGDSWVEQESEWLEQERGIPEAWRYVDFDYDHRKILEELAEASIAGILNDLPVGSPIESIEYESNWSPSAYNFQSDTYTAKFTVNWTQLKKWLKESGRDREEWMRERWSSYDGFHSHMYPGYWNDPEWRPGMKVYATIAMYLEEVIDRESQFMAVAEAEWEAYSNNVTLSIKEDDYATLLAKFLGADAPDEVQSEMVYDTDWVYDLMDCRGTDIETLMREHPLDPREASEVLSKRPDTEAITGQMAIL